MVTGGGLLFASERHSYVSGTRSVPGWSLLATQAETAPRTRSTAMHSAEPPHPEPRVPTNTTTSAKPEHAEQGGEQPPSP